MSISVSLRCSIWIEAGWKCFYCGCGLVVDDPGKSTDFNPQFMPGQIDRFATIDHVIPQQHGGTDDRSNLVAACMACNRKKKTKSLEEFRHACWTKSAAYRAFTGMVDACGAIGERFPEGVPENIQALFSPAFNYAKEQLGEPSDFKFYGETNSITLRLDAATVAEVVQ